MTPSLQHRAPGLRAAGLRRTVPWVLIGGAITVVLTGLAVLAAPVTEGRIGPMDLMSDPAEVTGIPWYIGAVSDLNLFVWAGGTAAYLLAALGLRRAHPRLAAALAGLGVVTLVFLADDRFLLHEIVYPWLLGISQLIAYIVYGTVLVLLVLLYSRVLLAQPEVGLLVLALFALAASVALDAIGWDSTTRQVAEEAAKLLGAALWSLFPAAIVVRHLDAAGVSRTESSRPAGEHGRSQRASVRSDDEHGTGPTQRTDTGRGR